MHAVVTRTRKSQQSDLGSIVLSDQWPPTPTKVGGASNQEFVA